MRALRRIGVTAFVTIVLMGLGGSGSANESKFQDLYDLLRTNLVGLDEAELNRAAVQGLLTQLYPRVVPVEDAVSDPSTNRLSPVTASVFEDSLGYLRVRQVGEGLAPQLAEAYQKLAASNQLKGLTLDLRFAGGQDYAAAANAAELFFATEQPLLDWGEGLRSSSAKTNAVTVPVAVLVNQKTAGAAEALAAILRQGEVGLVIGTNTAGQASIMREFALPSGQRLRVATAPLKLGKGKPIPFTGLKPDIHVDVSDEDEQAYYANAYRLLPPRAARPAAGIGSIDSGAVTNRLSRRRLNEADLVRMLREGTDLELDPPSPARETGPARSVVQDPALARALDLLKGLALLHQVRSI